MEEEKTKKKKSSKSHKKKNSEKTKSCKDLENTSDKSLENVDPQKDVAENEGSSSRKSNAGSPEGGCPICLGKLDNTSFTDSCFHQFCFTCLKEWTKVKPECPLCKQKYTNILFNVLSYENYEQISVADIQSSVQAENPHHRFRYRTTLTVERRLMLDFPGASRPHIEHDYTLMRPSRTRTTTRTHWRRQRESATSDFRRSVYMSGLRALEFRDQRMREREITPEFFTRNPATLHRLVPWLNRELNALLGNDSRHDQFLLDFILGLIKSCPINSEEFYNLIYPYLGRHTRQFMHEFEFFAKSPYNITAYDQNIMYEPQPIEVISAGDTTEDEDNDDVIIIGQVGSSSDPIDLSIGDSPPQSSSQAPPLPPEPFPEEPCLPPREPPAEHRLNNNHDYTPILNRVRQFLEEPPPHPSSLPSSGWDSPIPGPSWMDTNSDSGGVQEIPLPPTPPVISSTLSTVTLSTEKDPLPPPKKKGGIPVFPPMLTELFSGAGQTSIKIENSDSESSIGSDVIFVSIENPWEARPAVELSSDSGEEEVVQQTFRAEKKREKSKHYDKISTSLKRSQEKSRSRHERHHRRYELSSSRSRSRERGYTHHSRKHHKKHKFKEYERYRSRSRSRERYEGAYYYDNRYYQSSRPTYGDEYYSRMSRPRLAEDRRDWDYGRSYSRVIEAEYDRPKRHAYRSSSEDSYMHKNKKSKKSKKHKKHRKHKKHKTTYVSSDSDFEIIAVGKPKTAPAEVQSQLQSTKSTSSAVGEPLKYKKHPTGHKKKSSTVTSSAETSRDAPASPPDVGGSLIQEISQGNLCLSPISDSSTDSQINLLQSTSSAKSATKPSTSSHLNKREHSPVHASLNNFLSDISDGGSEEGEISDL